MPSLRFDAVDSFDAQTCIDFLDRAHNIAEVNQFKQFSYDLLRPQPGDRVLEIGCGIGIDARAIARKLGPTGRVVAVDRSSSMIAEAQRRCIGTESNVVFQQADVYALPFADGHFQSVRADRLLHFLARPAAAVAEMVRVVQAGGRVVIGEPDWDSLTIEGGESQTTAVILAHAWSGPSTSRGIGARLPQLFREAGLEVDLVVPQSLEVRGFQQSVALFQLAGLAYGAVVAGRLSAGDARNWFKSLDDASRRGELVCSLPGYTVAGVKPATR